MKLLYLLFYCRFLQTRDSDVIKLELKIDYSFVENINYKKKTINI